MEVRLHDGTLIILDAGSGIRPLGAALGTCDATLLLSHYHWDHIQGLPFFPSAYSPNSCISLFGPGEEGHSPGDVLSGQMAGPYFPAPISELRGITSYNLTPRVPFQIGSATVRAARVCHPSVTYGYRIEDEDGIFVYISDNEVDMAPANVFENIVDLASDADVLLHDFQYTEMEYAPRRGWGHSTPRQAVRVATEAGVQRLMAFHHDPSHSDEQVEAMAEEAREIAGPIDVIIGREGETVTVRQPAPKVWRPTG